jgi:crotonobetainyl-CoA:carnitine CoA-transferase CaiB-like acyl-CoA transferase
VKASEPRTGPLSGIRVLDIATMIAAPLAGSILGDYGADVVKVELPGAGDTVRKLGQQRDGVGLYWKTLSRNKKVAAIDLRRPEGQALLLRLIPQFDVLIENFRPGTLDAWNLSEEKIRQVNPKLVILRVTGFGQTGPYRSRHGFGTLAESMSGIASVLVRDMRDFPKDSPALTSFPMGDVSAAMMAVCGTLAALVQRERTGLGETVDLAIYEALLKFMEIELLGHDDEAPPSDTFVEHRPPDSAPRGMYRCKNDEWVALSGSAQPVAERILRLIGGEELVVDSRFRTNELRVQNVIELDAIIQGWCAQHTRENAIAIMGAAGCAIGPVETVRTLLRNPQVQARQAVLDVEDPGLGPLRLTNVIPRFARHDPAPPRPGPSLVGEDTATVLSQELGLEAEELEQLRSRGIIALPA